MTNRRMWRWSALVVALISSATAGCSFLISLDEVDHTAADGASNSVVIPDAAVSDAGVGMSDVSQGIPDVSQGTPDVSVDVGTVGMGRSDASSGGDATTLGDSGPSEAGTCANPMYPVPCPGRGSGLDGGVPAACWTTGTDCTTVVNCSGTYHGCGTSYAFNCATGRCMLTCTDPMYPVLCPAVGSPDAGGTTAGCWTATTDCSTVTNCSGTEHACRTGYRYNCAAAQCLLVSDAGDAAPPSTCEAGQANCGGRCVDLQSNAANCGACAHACLSGQQCTAGACCTPSDAGGACRLPACGCAAGSVCEPDTQATGLQCAVSDGLTEGADCSGVLTVCASGLGCFSGTCRRYCNSNVDCPLVDGVRLCQQTVWSDGVTPISGVLICRRICDPVNPQTPRTPLLSCPAGFGCFADAAGASTCIPGGTGVVDDACTIQSDCAPGYYCSAGGTCNRYCSSSNDCAPGDACFSFNTPLFGGSHAVGFCFTMGAFDGGVLD